jgi:hypothetical protein
MDPEMAPEAVFEKLMQQCSGIAHAPIPECGRVGSRGVFEVQTLTAILLAVALSFLSGCQAGPAFTIPVGGATGYLSGDVMQPWEGGPAYYQKWAYGPSSDPSFFPIAVWLQQPANVDAYKSIGINVYVGLWAGPTEAQLGALLAGQMPAICTQNSVGLTSISNAVVTAWMHQDEPDNAQALADGSGWGPPIPASAIVADYKSMRIADPTRPVYLNLGQGVAWDGWYGRGDRTDHPEDYAEYVKGADILSFDIYPMNSGDSTSEQAWLVAYGIDRLRQWSNYQKPVWCWLECTQIYSTVGHCPSPAEVKAQAWMAIIHGARGIGYFAHTLNPFVETGLLADSEMSSAVSAINAQISSLAALLNTPSVSNGVTVATDNTAVPVDAMLKRDHGYTYVFSVAMRRGSANATFSLRGFTGSAVVEVVGEDRQISAANGVFLDAFGPYSVHLYRAATPQ